MYKVGQETESGPLAHADDVEKAFHLSNCSVLYLEYTGWPKKLHHFLYALTLPNINHFLGPPYN